MIENRKNEISNLNYVNVNVSSHFKITKRMSDIIFSTIGLTLFSPFMILLFIIMKIENHKAPFIFSQERIGKDKKNFKMYKIRSMCPDAEEMLDNLLGLNEINGAMFKMKKDPRVTKVGRIIRKFSIDELPQLWNVLKGDMSLVGPRPPLGREVEKYSTRDLQRLLIKPGCTGLWQISGRNDVGFEEMVELDIFYIENQCLKLDYKILLKTILVVLKPNSAY